MLFQQLQKRNIDPIFIKAAICNFADSIINISSISSAPPETQQHLLCSSNHSSISSAPPITVASLLLLQSQQHLLCSSNHSSISSAPPITAASPLLLQSQ
uniref:Uncharacterized protein n=1 Tax=Knipowitschia caucasica TaxID=637954 RepID=A0AAV2LZ48_KNICA